MRRPFDTPDPSSPRRPLGLLLGGTVVGVIAAAAGLLTSGSNASAGLPADAAARVNDRIVLREDYSRLLTALANDKRSPIGPEQRKYVLDRLIEEELLIQRGLELGLAHHDARVRKDLTMSMIESIVAEFRDLDVDDETLRRFYAENQDFFTRAARFRVRQIWTRAATLADGDAAFERARQAAERLRAGEDFASVEAALGEDEISPVPDALLPPAKLADYLGPTALRTVMELEVGAISDPVRSSTGYHVLQLLERGGATAPAFAEVREQVLSEYRRRKADDALRAYLDDLRSRADVEVADDLEKAEPGA